MTYSPYSPSPAPGRAEGLPTFLAGELERIAAALRSVAAGRVEPTFKAPEKPRDGDVRLADGAEWDPGGGAGVYAWYGGAWHRLG